MSVLDSIRDHVQEAMAEWRIPGVAVSIVKDGEVVMNAGFGLRDIEGNLPMTENTLLAIGSCSKAFTATAIAMLVDEGLVEWDRPVRDYMPTFGMYDPLADAGITPRDLLCHRCGLPGHDFLWYNTHQVSRRELVERIRYLQPTRGFRAEFQYQNLIYAAAGYLVEAVTGQTWEDFVRERIFAPLGMKTSNFSVDDMPKADDYSLPYELQDGQVRLMDYAKIDNIGPAGSINSSVSEMAQWVLLQLRTGKYGDQQLVSEKNFRQIHMPHTVVNDPVRQRIYGNQLMAYALGWLVQFHRGHQLIWHSGGIDGFIANVSFMPEINAGAVVLTNLNVNRMVPGLVFTIYDRLRGLEDADWNAHYQKLVAEMEQEAQEAEQKFDAARIPDTKLSHPLDDYTGTFAHPGYGAITVTRQGEGLQQTYNDLTHEMKHYHYDTFETIFEIEMRQHRLTMTYTTDAQGKLVSLGVPFEPQLAPITFTRTA